MNKPLGESRCERARAASSEPAVQRLKTRQQFQAVMDGVVVSRTPHFVLHRLVLSATPLAEEAPGSSASASAVAGEPLFAAAPCWIGAVVPKRWARRAVTRNAIKRQIYTVSASHAACLPQAAHVVRLRTTFDRTHFVSATSGPLKQAVRAELEQLLTRAGNAPRLSDGKRRTTQARPA